MLAPWKKSYDQPRQLITKQRHYFANKGPSSQSYDFSSSHAWVWELDHKDGWALKNWCFWTVVLEKTLESPGLQGDPTSPSSKGDQPWVFFGRNDAKAETPVLWPPDAKSWLIGKDSDAGRDLEQEEQGVTEDEVAEWHHRLDGHLSCFHLLTVVNIEHFCYEYWCAAIHGVAKSWTGLSDWSDLIWLVCKYLFKTLLSIPLEICPDVRLLAHIEFYFLSFWGVTILFCTVVTPFYSPTNNVPRFQFLYILASMLFSDF